MDCKDYIDCKDYMDYINVFDLWLLGKSCLVLSMQMFLRRVVLAMLELENHLVVHRLKHGR